MKASLPDAPKILLHNVYGWFVRIERGLYALSEGGKAALIRWNAQVPISTADMRLETGRMG